MVKHARSLLKLREGGKVEGGKLKNRGQEEKEKCKAGEDKEVG